MKGLYWNIRGIANKASKLALRRLVNSEKPDFIIIAEPWMSFDNFPRRWLHRLDLKLFSVNIRDNLLPNIWCICKNSLDPDLLYIDDQCVAFKITALEKSFCVAAVYASNCYIKRRSLWAKLSDLTMIHDLPWCYMGDFNVILGMHEYSGIHCPDRQPMVDFHEWTSNNNFLHLPTKGAWFTWSNGRKGRAHTEKRLDRVICNQSWVSFCNNVTVSTLVNAKSDHYPILLDFNFSNTTFTSQFKFHKMWSLHDSCKDLISNVWSTSFVGCPMFILCSKLKLLKERLKIWNKQVFGNVHSFVKDAEENLSNIQSHIINNGYTDGLRELEKNAQNRLEEALTRQDWFWQEKARVNWHVEGDRNTGYFHRIAKIRNNTKTLSSIRAGDTLLLEPTQIADHIVHYYKNLFCTNHAVLQDSMLIDEVIPQVIDNNVNNLLTLLPSIAEIRNAVFGLNKDGAPGPDGFGAFFFQNYWDIVHKDVEDAVLQFFHTGWILPNFNANNVILIPKSSNADSIEQYRPIAMANFKFKVISKILADRLALIMPSLISMEQRGFIKGRNIIDCICLASEAANLLHNKVFGGNLLLKIDITKAFDTLEWPFLITVLRGFGFCEKFCNWIDTILKSASLSISINGKMHGYFNCTRGVRQGDPLSPLLFCIAEEVLSRNISKLVADGQLLSFKGTRNVSVPSHCLYADDVLIFCNGRQSNLIALKKLFTRYAMVYGQVVNASKSTIYVGSLSQARVHHIALFLGFIIGALPFTYLGVPIFKGKTKSIYLQPIADRIKSKLAAWKASLLSIAGRVQLVKSVIHSMLIYSISIYSWPISLLKDLEKWMKNFIWSGDLHQKKLVTVAWKKVCKPTSEGGLGIRSIITLNEASNLKLCWDLLTSQDQWAVLLKSRVIRGQNCINHHIFSSIWCGIKNEFNVIWDNTRFNLGNGKDILFWTDKWCDDNSLADLLFLPISVQKNLQAKVVDFIQSSQC
jgi:exonuclease III